MRGAAWAVFVLILAGCASPPTRPLPNPVQPYAQVAPQGVPLDRLAPVNVTLLGNVAGAGGANLYTPGRGMVAWDWQGADGVVRLLGEIGATYFVIGCNGTCETTPAFVLPAAGVAVSVETFELVVDVMLNGTLETPEIPPDGNWTLVLPLVLDVNPVKHAKLLARVAYLEGNLTWRGAAASVVDMHIGLEGANNTHATLVQGSARAGPFGGERDRWFAANETLFASLDGGPAGEARFVVWTRDAPVAVDDLDVSIRVQFGIGGNGCKYMVHACGARH